MICVVTKSFHRIVLSKHKCFSVELVGATILLSMTLKSRLILQNNSRIVVGCVQINTYPSNRFPTVHSPARFHQNCHDGFDCCEQ